MERDRHRQLLQAKTENAANMRARTVKHSVGSATLHHCGSVERRNKNNPCAGQDRPFRAPVG